MSLASKEMSRLGMPYVRPLSFCCKSVNLEKAISQSYHEASKSLHKMEMELGVVSNPF